MNDKQNFTAQTNTSDTDEIDLLEIGYLLLQHLTGIVACLIGGALVAVCLHAS